MVAYSLDIGSEHVNLVDEKLQKRIYKGTLEASELDRFLFLGNIRVCLIVNGSENCLFFSKVGSCFFGWISS